MFVGHVVDGHVHADGLRDVDLETLARFGVTQALVCAHDGALPRPSASTVTDWFHQFDRLLSVEVPRFQRMGIKPLVALGIHPTSAPWLGIEELLHELPRYLSHPSVVAIGSLGLRLFDEREAYILECQLELAARLRRPVMLSAPIRDPLKATQQLVTMVRKAGVPAEHVLVERVVPTTIPLLHSCGYSIGLEPSPGRLELSDVVRAVQHFGPEQFILTSHAGEGAADLLAVPMVASSLADANVPRAVIRQVAHENLLRFVQRAPSLTKAWAG